MSINTKTATNSETESEQDTMSENTPAEQIETENAAAETETTADGTETAPHEPQEADQEAESSNPNREAAKYRKRAQQAEQERDELAAQLTAAKAGIVAERLTGRRVTLDALTAAGHDPASFVNADGQIDKPALEAAIKDTSKRFQILPDMYIPGEGRTPSRASTDPWAGAFAPAKS